MKSLLPAKAYLCEDWFRREQRQLFRPLWQFVAPRMLLARPNTFVRRQLAGVDVVVQNIDGQICAFENVCAHRLSPIQNEPQGVRPLVCPYHAWRYGSQGEVLSIPAHDKCYRFSPSEREALRLRQFAVFEFGQLIFVNLNAKPMDFWTQFDQPAVQSLQNASEMFDSEVLLSCIPGRFNWKLAYENLRDNLHPQFLHTRTLYQQVKFKAGIDEDELIRTQHYRQTESADHNEHLTWLRSFSRSGPNEPITALPHYPWHDNVQRYGTDDCYLNWLMYPNLHVASSSAGYSFIMEHHLPVSAQHTDLWIYYVTGRKKRKYPSSAAVLIAHLEDAEKVLSEDIDIMEKVQSSLETTNVRATIGDFEHANMAIEKWYLDVMEERHAL